MDKTLLALHGLKWNPFGAELPVEAPTPTQRQKTFVDMRSPYKNIK